MADAEDDVKVGSGHANGDAAVAIPLQDLKKDNVLSSTRPEYQPMKSTYWQLWWRQFVVVMKKNLTLTVGFPIQSVCVCSALPLKNHFLF